VNSLSNESLSFLVILVIVTIVSFSTINDVFANHQDDLITQPLKAEMQDASPILSTGFISTSTTNYLISNQFEVRHIWAGDLMRVSGVTVDGYPYYIIHKMNFNDLEISGKILVDGKVIPIIKNIIVQEAPVVVPEIKEPILTVEEDPIPIKAVILQPHSTYWRSTYNINIKVFEADQNSRNDYWYRGYLVPDVPIVVDITHENGNHLTTIQGKTDQSGHFEGQYYIIENLVQAGKYFVHVVAGDEKSGDVKDLTTFVIGEVIGARADDDLRSLPTFNPSNPVHLSMVNLIGSNSYDSNGTIVAYLWVQTGGPAAAPAVPINADTTFTTAGAGTYSYQLTVTDNDGNSDTGSITIIVT